MSEQTKDPLLQLIKFVDEKFEIPGFKDILAVFPVPFILVGLFSVAVVFAIIVSPNIFSDAWVVILFSLAAFFASFYSFNLASRRYANKRIANREAKRLLKILNLKIDDADFLLPPLVALKIENYHIIKLERLYEINKEYFSIDKLSEYYKST